MGKYGTKYYFVKKIMKVDLTNSKISYFSERLSEEIELSLKIDGQSKVLTPKSATV